MSALNKRGNEYLAVLGTDYERTPKAVYAALAVSLAHRCIGEGDDAERFAQVKAFLREEWAVLYGSGVVPQSAPGARAKGDG